jgi:hypothetical protein
MPSTSYRRKLRTSRLIVPTIYNYESDLVVTQQYFYKVLDMIIQQQDFKSTVSILQNIIQNTNHIVEYYKILDIIESDLLSVLMNISDNINTGIIRTRIEYIKTYIDQLPPTSIELSPVSEMVLQIIDLITNTSFTAVVTNIKQIHSYINDTYLETQRINEIQDNILSIICNISESTSSGIVSERVQYLRQLISHLSLK